MSPWLSDVFLRSQSDERLVNLARAGHDRAFAAIVERYRRQLQARARRLCSDGRAEDIVQQTFLSALTALRGGAEIRHLSGWLHQILRHTAARSTASTPLETAFDEASCADDADPDPLERRLLALSALAEVARLPVRQRDAFVATALHGQSRAEIAGSMGLSEGAVRQLVHRARATVRAAVTAVTPYPLAEWLGTSGASVGRVGLKLGAAVISGVLTTGIISSSLHGHPAFQRAPRLGAGPAPAPGSSGPSTRAVHGRLSGFAAGTTGGLRPAATLRRNSGSSTSRGSVPAALVSIRGEHAQGSGSGDGSRHGGDGSRSPTVGSGQDGVGSGHGGTQNLTGGGDGPSSGDGAGSRAGAPAAVGVQASVDGPASGADHGSGSDSSGSDHGSSSTGGPSSSVAGSGVPSGGHGH